MQKLFKTEPPRTATQAEKENLGQSRVEAIEASQVKGEGEEPRTDAKPAVADTPAKTDKEYDDFESAAKGQSDDKTE